jgi:hypothetical protein
MSRERISRDVKGRCEMGRKRREVGGSECCFYVFSVVWQENSEKGHFTCLNTVFLRDQSQPNAKKRERPWIKSASS